MCAVSYLNTVPLIWGFEHTALGEQVRLEYALPSECADRIRDGAGDIGILPVIEIEQQRLEWLRGVGIACRGPVRSILLISKVALPQVRTLAADIGSRTSVMLARILLAERYQTEPLILPMHADLDAMLAKADAALIIGDPALHLDLDALRRRCEVVDLGDEWMRHTGLPMIFALWAGPGERLRPGIEDLFVQSCRYGLAHLDDIVRQECPRRGIPESLGRQYLTRHIVSLLDEHDYEGMRVYLRRARDLANLRVSGSVSA